MTQAIMSKKGAHALTFALFLLGIAFLLFIKAAWWPTIMLAIGLPLALRQYLLGKRYDMTVSLIVFVGIFITVRFNIAWEHILPVLLTIGALYIFLKEFIAPEDNCEEKNKE